MKSGCVFRYSSTSSGERERLGEGKWPGDLPLDLYGTLVGLLGEEAIC